MRFASPSLLSKIAPGFPRAFFFAAAASLLLASCKKGGTPDWDTPGDTPPPQTSAATAPVAAPIAAPAVAPPETEEKPLPTATASSEGLRFINYNVKNWLTMDRRPLKDAPKPDEEKQAVISLLARHAPDVIGLCEIGTKEDLAEIQSMLGDAGLDLPHSHYSAGSDPVRRLGLLSRFPITSTSESSVMEYKMDGKLFGFNRGILDATVTARDRSYRFLGVHLKSKREVREGDQETMRRNEARLLREHVDAILEKEPDARLVVYGDFNDTRPSPSFRTVTGTYNSPGYLTAVRPRDSRGHTWTHFWEQHEIYSRIDFVTVTSALRREVNFDASHLIEDPEWETASDHRPIVVIFR